MIGLQTASTQSGELDLNKLASQLSGQSLEVFDRLSLMPTDENGDSVMLASSQSPSLTQPDTIPAANSASSATQGSLGDRLLHIAYQLNSLYLKQRLSQLTEQIKRASILDQNDLADMKTEFTQVSEEIRQLNKKLNTA